jgi:hypothetical protein
MKLTDLDAELVVTKSLTTFRRLEAGAAVSTAQGILFWCPICHADTTRAHPILIWFNDRGVDPAWEPVARWLASGASIVDLSLTPSINLDTESARAHPNSCRWHGWVTNGEAA